jgi:hypothetical protein
MPREKDVPAMPPGFVMLKGPPGNGGLSFGGLSYKADEEGIVTIPMQAIADARAHGFRDPAEAEVAEARDTEMAAKDATIAILKAKLAMALAGANAEQARDGGHAPPPSDAERRGTAGG